MAQCAKAPSALFEVTGSTRDHLKKKMPVVFFKAI
jgi:hypothetical protein